jgi:hypothetical protein
MMQQAGVAATPNAVNQAGEMIRERANQNAESQ